MKCEVDGKPLDEHLWTVHHEGDVYYYCSKKCLRWSMGEAP